MTGPLLDAAALIAGAEAATGLSDWGEDQRFREPLAVLVRAVNAMAPPQPFMDMAAGRIGASLEVILRYAEDARNHPDILEQKIERPIIVIGLPRTGTTVMYDLLALDPALRSPAEWEFFFPWPAPEAATWNSDPRIATLGAIYDQFLEQAPELANIHDFTPTHSSECNLAFAHHFASTNFTAEWGVRELEDWLVSSRVPGRYAAHKRILQQLQWKGPRGRWLLKSPEHLFDLEGLMAAYPDATLVWTHRDPLMALSSLSSFLQQFRNINGFGNDPREVGRCVFNQWTTALERGMASRAANPAIEARIIDISHADVIADKIAVLRRIYAHAGQPFPPEHESRVRSEVESGDARRFSRLGKHKHDPATFGIEAKAVRDRLPDYLGRFGDLLKQERDRT